MSPELGLVETILGCLSHNLATNYCTFGMKCGTNLETWRYMSVVKGDDVTFYKRVRLDINRHVSKWIQIISCLSISLHTIWPSHRLAVDTRLDERRHRETLSQIVRNAKAECRGTTKKVNPRLEIVISFRRPSDWSQKTASNKVRRIRKAATIRRALFQELFWSKRPRRIRPRRKLSWSPY